jgi:hypothetical protein
MNTGLVLMQATLVIASGIGATAQGKPDLDKIYQDQSHCLTAPDMRGDKDRPISCFCRDAIVMARYVHTEYLLSMKDRNLSGIFLTLVQGIPDQCGAQYETALEMAESEKWVWDGPEVVRVYPPDEVIKRIPPVPNSKTVMRWVPYTVQLLFRDVSGRVSHTENYSSRELVPDFDPEKKTQ